MIVYAQIIDFLIYFDGLKRIEQMGKKRLQPNASVQKPPRYAERFRNFLAGSDNTVKHVFKGVEEGESDWLSKKEEIESSIANTKFGDFYSMSNAE